MPLLEARLPEARGSTPSAFNTLTVLAIVLSALSVMWSFFDARSVGDAAAWVKPLKFSVSFAVLFATIAIIETRMSPNARNGWPMQIIAWIMGTAFIAEMAYMMYQAARAEGSHFNFSTPFNEFMYTTVMGGGAIALVASIGAIGFIVLRDRDGAFGPALRQGIWLGFLLSFALTMIVAMYLSMQTGHHVGVHPEGAPTLPFVGWSGVTGDLRPAHFLSLHAMQVLPLLGLWLDRRDAGSGVRLIHVAAAGYAVLTLAVFGQALLGLPLIPFA